MKIRNMVLAAFFAAITAICSQIAIPTGIAAVPFSLCVVGVFLSGALLDVKTAAISQAIFIFMGAVGLPVFSQAQGGFSVLAGPTGGYIFVYPLMAFLISFICSKTKKRSFVIMLLSMIPALVCCYITGSLWLSFISDISVGAAFAAGAVPFIIPDIIKIILSSVLSQILLRALRKRYPGYLQN